MVKKNQNRYTQINETEKNPEIGLQVHAHGVAKSQT